MEENNINNQQEVVGNTQQPAAENMQSTPQPQKKSNKTAWIISIAAAIIVALMVISNPSREQHEMAIRSEMETVASHEVSSDNDDVFSAGISMVAKAFTGSVVNAVLSNLMLYHNYGLWSTSTVAYGGEEHRIAFGLLGHVFTMNSDDIIKAIDGNQEAKDSIASQTGRDVNDAIDNTVDQAFDAAGDAAGDALDKAMDAAVDKATSEAKRIGKEAKDKALTSAGEEVKKQIKENTDSSTVDEGTIDRIVDDITNWLKSL